MPGFLSPRECLDSSVPGEACLSIPEYSGINKEQRIPDRSKRAHRKPPVKCFLTGYRFSNPYSRLSECCSQGHYLHSTSVCPKQGLMTSEKNPQGRVSSLCSKRCQQAWLQSGLRKTPRDTSKTLLPCCCCSAIHLCPTLCDPRTAAHQAYPVLYHLPEFVQTHVH